MSKMWKLAVAAAVLAVLAPVAYGGAGHTPQDHKFSAHMKANGCSTHWDSPDGTVCYIHVTDWSHGVADGFHGSAKLSWCAYDPHQRRPANCTWRLNPNRVGDPYIHVHWPEHGGYNRWVLICRYGDVPCQNWLLGATVAHPGVTDAPFVVLAGRISYQPVRPSISVHPDSTERNGGPLLLHHVYDGKANRDQSPYLYRFGLRGWLHW